MRFIDLHTQRDRIRSQVDRKMTEVLDRADFINGSLIPEFEETLSNFNGGGQVVACANGTDALTIVGQAEGIGPGKAVFVPAFTFVASAGAFAILGATPFFVDIDPLDFNICPESLEVAISEAKGQGLDPAMIVAVDMFGQPARYKELRALADKYDLVLVSDAAQAFGALQEGKRSRLEYADWVTTSFFPAKPLGCYGDGGAVLCRSKERAELAKSIAQHGKGTEKYDNVRIGMNSRLDTLQAAVLLCKLDVFAEELEARQGVADYYGEGLSETVVTPTINEGNQSSWAQYTIRVESSERRHSLQQHMKDAGIPTVVYYPKPLNEQAGFRRYPVVSKGLKNSMDASQKVLSLPMHPYLKKEEIDRVIKEVVCWRRSVG